MMEKELLITRRDGGKLHAVHYQIPGDCEMREGKLPPLVILCHGFTGDKYEWGRFPTTARTLNEAGLDAILFDFSGSGENEREFIRLSQQAKDLEDVYGWAKAQNYEKIGIIGLSFGGLTALVANLPNVNTIVYWAPGFNIRSLFGLSPRMLARVKERMSKKPMTYPTSGETEPISINGTFIEDLIDYEPDGYLESMKYPALIIQGTEDKAVNPADIRKAFELIPQDEDHKLIEIENADHDFKDEHLEKFIKLSKDWLKKYLS